LTEGAQHVLGWKSPNYLYYNAIKPKLKVLLKNFKLSDDIAFRFSNSGWEEYPLTASKYVDWIKETDDKGETINLFMDYETFGEHQNADTGIFSFLKDFPKKVFKKTNISFSTPAEVIRDLQPVAAVHVPYPISWADEERDLTAWLGNDLQEDAFSTLYSLINKINKCTDKKILTDWKYLQASDHFYYMSTKMLSDGDVHSYFNPFESPYDAYINYMNILSDFIIRLNAAVPESDTEKEISTLAAIIYEKNVQIEKYEEEIRRLKTAGKKTVSKTRAAAKPKAEKKAPKKASTAPKVGTKSKTPSRSTATAKAGAGSKTGTGKAKTKTIKPGSKK